MYHSNNIKSKIEDDSEILISNNIENCANTQPSYSYVVSFSSYAIAALRRNQDETIT
ncbi:MAG TPA: hypothetical protein VKA09_03270 [Nitrososphaeraceae archaeon]|nr:hypothetical protein [Nitrososphaeraceae archaeon]